MFDFLGQKPEEAPIVEQAETGEPPVAPEPVETPTVETPVETPQTEDVPVVETPVEQSTALEVALARQSLLLDLRKRMTDEGIDSLGKLDVLLGQANTDVERAQQ